LGSKFIGMISILLITFFTILATYCIYKPDTETVKLAETTVYIITSTGLGSGVYLGNGIVLTAYHVVKDAEEIKIQTTNDEPFRASTGPNGHSVSILWTSTQYDVALLEMDYKNVKVSTVACQAPEVGSDVEAIGQPYGIHFIHKWGKVAGKPIVFKSGLVGMPVDITIAPGMSGGPLFDKNHQVVGISDMMISDSEKPGFVSFMVPGSAICKLLAKR